MKEPVNRQEFENGKVFSGLISLTNLVITNCGGGETKIRQNMFKHLGNLELLNLGSNKIDEID
jgi:hypothetical protein